MSEVSETSDAPEAIGELVRKFRKRQGLSQSDLAKAADVSDGMIGNVERGTRNLGVETVQRVADALDLTDGERARLLEARRRFGHYSPNGSDDDSWDELKSSLSEQDRAAVRAIIESLKAKNHT